MKKNALPIVLIGSILLFALVSCASTPEDMMISTVAADEVQVVQEVAQQLAYLDGNNLLGNTDVAAAARLLELLQDSLEDPSLPAAARSGKSRRSHRRVRCPKIRAEHPALQGCGKRL